MTRKFEEISTGVIGVGSMGQNHVRVMSEISNLVGVSDSDVDRTKFRTCSSVQSETHRSQVV